MFTSTSLEEWLTYIDQITPNTIELGLERTNQVKERLNLIPKCPVISVTGTNGKGSVCAYLTAIYKEAGFKTGTLTSPHLISFNERIAINAEPVSDELIIEAFNAINIARGDIPLSYFEFNTLAAVWIFAQQKVDVMILEVGLGGRLDAINVFDADCTVLTNIEIDHTDYLGDTVEAIGYEKAGLFRSGNPAICGQIPVPNSVTNYAKEIGAQLYALETDFTYSKNENNQWNFTFNGEFLTSLPLPTLKGSYQIRNASCALAAVYKLSSKLSVTPDAIKRGLINAKNTGRFQVVSEHPTIILDVAHNPHAAQALVDNLKESPIGKKQIAVFSMLTDKDIDEVVRICKDSFDVWCVSGLDNPRGLGSDALIERMQNHDINHILPSDSIVKAYEHALSIATEDDRIVIFGSFFTVAEILAYRSS